MSQRKPQEPNWPPRSPHEVLLSTPGGRERLRRLAERHSPSPSPIKRSKSNPSLQSRASALLTTEMDEDEDDEETLQLQLQEIQARLKLKKLQKKSKQTSDSETENGRTAIREPSRSGSVAASRAESRLAGIRAERLERTRPQTTIDVPVSPIRKAQPPTVQRSPSRVLLGIDKGLKGSDISLRRAPSQRRKDDPVSDRLAGPFLQRPASQASARLLGATSSSQSSEERPKTFSERLAAIRAQDTDRQDRDIRIKRSRSQAFDIDHEQMQSYKENAVPLPEAPRQPDNFSREDVLRSTTSVGGISRSKTVPDLGIGSGFSDVNTDTSATLSERPGPRAAQTSSKGKSSMPVKPPDEVTESEASQFEPYSSQHLSKRIIPHQRLTRTLTGKKSFQIPELLRTVKGPDFSGPDIEDDVVVFAIIASKSEPKAHQPNANAKNQKRGKFMVMSLTDLKWELDLFLFDTAFDKFWKMTPGTIIAILNPMFMPPPRGKADTGKFSLTLNSDADTVLEIGTARDLGFCKSVKKDGKTCDSWVDRRHTEFCDFHVNQALQKTRASRMEVNSMNYGKGNFKAAGGRGSHANDATSYADRKKKIEAEKLTRYDRDSHSQIYIGKRSTVNMLDDVDFDPDAFHRGSTKEERMTRRVLAQEKERELERKLGSMGTGLGAEYVRARRRDVSSRLQHPSGSSSTADNSLPDAPPNAAALGLLGGKAADVMLSPVKRKRPNTDMGSGSAAMGWGRDLTKQLGRMKDGESLQQQQPVKKKTRFVTAKGIREAGRESLGGEVGKEVLMGAADDDDDDDDDLDIVRE